MSHKLRAAVVGATGYVGQRFVSLLADHPWFELTMTVASPNSAGKSYAEAVRGRWRIDVSIPEAAKTLLVHTVDELALKADQVDLIFCAVDMPKEEIKLLEERLARTETPVISNNSANRLVNGPQPSDRLSAQTSGHDFRLYRLQTQLFHPKLCTGPGSFASFRYRKGHGQYLSSDFGSGEDLCRLAGDGRESDSFHWR